MKNRKGFTLVEILVTIAILGMLTSVAVFSVSNLTKNARAEKDTQNVNTLKMAAESYAQANKEYLPKLVGESTRIEISELNNNNFIKENITDQNDKSCMSESYVDVTKISKNEYIYEPHLICEGKEITSPTENEETKTNPEIIITINGKKPGKEVKSGDLVNANYSISFKGDTKDGSIGIISYSYSISVNNVEVYNSGNQLGNNEPTISINDINISKYLDLTKDNEVSIKGVLINKEGDRATKTNKITVTEDNSVIISDDTPPVCPSLENNPDGREGEPAENTDWLNKKDIKDGLKRQISLTCNDGNGSGCKRQKFSKTWPNNSDKEGKTIIKDTITLTDNTGKESECEVNVNIDAVSPKLSVLEDKNIKKTITVEANNNYNETDPKATIESNNEYYNNLYNNKWLNASAITKDGISYSIEASDDIGIKNIKWETKNNTKEGSISDENINLDIAGEKSYEFNVSFIHDGEREGTITVEDVAGNTAKIVIKANLDRTPPTTPTVNMYKWKNEEPKSNSGLKIYNKSNGEEWSNKNIYSEVKSTDSVSGIDDNSYQSTLTKSGQATTKNGKNLNITDEGQMLVKYKVCDNAANCIETDSYNVWIDKTNPTCTNEVVSSSAPNKNGWITTKNSTVTITAKCKDELSKCKEENPASMIYNEQINIKNAGASGIGKKTTVEDNAGNKATCPANQEIKMDWEPPSIPEVEVYKWKSIDKVPTSAADLVRINGKSTLKKLDNNCITNINSTTCDWIDSKVYTRAINSTDKLSGLDFYKYTTTGETTNETDKVGAKRNIEPEGQSTIMYSACDKAGNCSAYNVSNIKISKYAPTITCKLDKSGNITNINIKTTGDKYYFNDCSRVTSDRSKCESDPNYKTEVTSMATTSTGIKATWGDVSMPATCGRTYYAYVRAQSVTNGKETIAKCSGSYSTKNCDECDDKHPEKCPWVTSCRAGDTTLYVDHTNSYWNYYYYPIYAEAGTAYHSLYGRNDRIYVLPKTSANTAYRYGKTWRRVYIPSYDRYYSDFYDGDNYVDNHFVFIAENCLGPYDTVCPYSQCPG